MAINVAMLSVIVSCHLKVTDGENNISVIFVCFGGPVFSDLASFEKYVVGVDIDDVSQSIQSILQS